MRGRRYIFPFFFVVFVMLMSFVKVACASDVDFLDLPTKVGEAFGISSFAGGLICSLIMFMTFLFPSLYLCKDQNGSIMLIVVLTLGISVMGICIAINWLPIWMLILTIMGIVAIISVSFGHIFGGSE